MNLNSFDDVAKHIANENTKLSERIVHGFKTELAKVRDDMKGDLDSLSNNLYDSVQRVEDEQSSQKSRIAQLEDTVARMQRITELIISGVPVTANESCVNIVTKIASVINCHLNANAIRAFRLNKTGHNQLKKRLRNMDNANPPIIMVKFPSTSDKNDFFSKYLSRKNLSLTDIGYTIPQRIYVKENLTPQNYKIFQACENAKRAGSIDKYFTRDGTCHMVLQPNGKTIKVDSLEFFHETVNMNYKTNRTLKNPKGGTNIAKKQSKKPRLDTDSSAPQSAQSTNNPTASNQLWSNMVVDDATSNTVS